MSSSWNLPARSWAPECWSTARWCGTPMAGDDFFSALLRIWLGDKPVDSGLKKGVLGGG
jgi:hypothetical protein